MKSFLSLLLALALAMSGGAFAFAKDNDNDKDKDDKKQAAKKHKKAEPNRITNGPVIESIFDKSAVIAWSTSAPSSSIVRFGTEKDKLLSTARSGWMANPHRVFLKPLKPSTTYYFQLVSGQALGTGTEAHSPVYSLTTVAKGAKPNREHVNVGVK